MNASDITKNIRNRTLYQAYYRPTIFPGVTNTGESMFIKSTVSYCPVSTVSTGGEFVSSFVSSTNLIYTYKCFHPVVDYQLANDINMGKYNVGYPCCSTITNFTAGETAITGTCNCKISYLSWTNNNVILQNNYSTLNYSSVITDSSIVTTGQTPIICPLVEFYQGTNFDNNCLTSFTRMCENTA
jgi:hypothetical protein